MHRLLRITDKKLQFTIDFLKQAGFSKDAGILYFILTKYGPLTLLDASRKTGIERTKLYRISDELINVGLIEEVIDYKKKLLKAGNLDRIHLLVTEKQAQAEFLTASFPAFSQLIESTQDSSPVTKVLYYRGTEGIKQMMWNELSLKGEGIGYIHRVLEEVVGIRFFRQWAEEFKRRKLKFREIRTKQFDISEKKLSKKTIVPGSKIRYIASKTLPISHQMEIYNDVVAIYNWHSGEVFGVEIHNEQVATMQKKMFEVFWNLATPTKI